MDAVPPPNSKLNRFKGRKNNQRLSVVRNNSPSQEDARRKGKGKGKTGIQTNLRLSNEEAAAVWIGWLQVKV
jgi:trehalose-6-phosphate synthase